MPHESAKASVSLCSSGGQKTQERTETTDHGSSKCDSGGSGVAAAQKEKVKGKDETYWKEINAAMALTNLAQGKDSVSGTTSCIIQKSSHIAEIKTVKVPLVQKY
ncbi:hypothetical protein INR49_021063 [Caranx melampygus]|nr:hypothetical protein INR49_021063 [Caranx melampygus]